MNNHILQQIEIERDLEVLISNDLEWCQHVISAPNKANRQIGIIKHPYKYLDNDNLKLLYKFYLCKWLWG